MLVTNPLHLRKVRIETLHQVGSGTWLLRVVSREEPLRADGQRGIRLPPRVALSCSRAQIGGAPFRVRAHLCGDGLEVLPKFDSALDVIDSELADAARLRTKRRLSKIGLDRTDVGRRSRGVPKVHCGRVAHDRVRQRNLVSRSPVRCGTRRTPTSH